ncbi:MAG: hypothetical protein ACYS32_19555 [Planctomycetota bacterium]|jgi:hypothetical protein
MAAGKYLAARASGTGKVIRRSSVSKEPLDLTVERFFTMLRFEYRENLQVMSVKIDTPQLEFED